MFPADAIRSALQSVPPGRWVVGVSGGADSVALLSGLCRCRPDVLPIVAHLNHESRGVDSDADESFVRALAGSLGVECATAKLARFVAPPSAGHEAVYRSARLAFFRRLVRRHDAAGVLLAHHADDRAETVLLRLLRGGEPSALAGLRREAKVAGLRLVRPLLTLRRATLETFLRGDGQAWRVDASNASDAFARNRVRVFLADRPDLVDPLLVLADAAEALRGWIHAHAPRLPEAIPIDLLADLPDPLARSAGRRWLRECGVRSPGPRHVDRLILMARDRASPRRIDLPDGIRLQRREKTLIAVTGSS